ncbi:hypothetical protein [Burkholderia sp. BCC1047]|nr:hypothetical protein [Burkholderia sp. BCC1047]
MIGMFRRGALEFAEAPAGNGHRAGERPMLTEHLFATRFLLSF